MTNKQLITELIFLKLDIERKTLMYQNLMQELEKKELNQEERGLVKKHILKKGDSNDTIR